MEQYMGRIIHEVLPMVTDRVRGSVGWEVWMCFLWGTPGGSLEQYMGRVIHEVLPMVTDKVRGRCGVGSVRWEVRVWRSGTGKVCKAGAGLAVVWSIMWDVSFTGGAPHGD